MVPAFSAAPTFEQHKANQCVSCASNQVVVTLTSNVTAGSDLWETGEVFTAKPNQHPVDFSSLNVSGASDSTLYNSNADMVSPSARISPATNCGTGTPACKVGFFTNAERGMVRPEHRNEDVGRHHFGRIRAILFAPSFHHCRCGAVPRRLSRAQLSLYQFLGTEAR